MLRLKSSKRQNIGRAQPVGMDPSALGMGKRYFWGSTIGMLGIEEAREEAIQDTHHQRNHDEIVVEYCYL